ncbi:hypothetical protein CF032_13805 [Klebsiella oxytoca]|uniref:hypothetical protein n=1 Tax=Klebsiella oxytoca TaxID=571 RepID=UPI001C825253|nr:hypothetical protein [Klebsiella oxytoca]MBX4507749.1 hypothetical protein [Klebsiella oxytoca]
MALPWLIGAAVLGVGAWIASSSSNDSSNGNGGDDEERRRRERAEQERRAREQQELRNSIKATFSQEGKQRANDFQQLLSGWVNVDYQSQPSFKATILQTGKQYMRTVEEHFTDINDLHVLNATTRENLKVFEECYDVELTMTETFHKAVDELADCEEQLQKLQDYRRHFERIHQHLRG